MSLNPIVEIMALAEERNSSFNKHILTDLIYKRIVPDIPLARLREIQEMTRRFPDMMPTLEKYHMSREQLIKKGLAQGRCWKNLIQSENLDKHERKAVLLFHTELSAHIMHYEFFIPSFELQASEAQKQKWLTRLNNLEVIGCYAQTEIAHGSNVRGIEMEARYDHSTKEFIFHSPSQTAIKWWIGGLGVVANHALLIANLILSGQNLGPHPFFIQIRDLNTHEPLEGVEVGDIGAKIGLNGNDNGYLKFDNFRQPMEVMLTRFAKINDNGEYEILDTNAIKILYLSLIRARSALIFDAWHPLAISLTISMRYSLIRTQFADLDNPLKERKILDYQMQRKKLFTVLARLYSLIFTSAYARKLYIQGENKLKNGDDSDLGLLHCIISLFKSYVTYNTLESIEECRRSCGGHGFLLLSGLPAMYTEYLPSITYDGDNSILTLQAARFIINTLKNPKQAHKDLEFLITPAATLKDDVRCPQFLQSCFEAVARLRFQKVLQKKNKLLIKGLKKSVIWNTDLQVEAIEACEAVYYAIVHREFMKGIMEIEDLKCRDAVEEVRKVFAASEIERFNGDLMKAGYGATLVERIQQMMIQGLDEVRKNSLVLTEAFDIQEDALNSVIANKDGRIYDEMIRTTKELNPLNKQKVFPGIKELLKPKL